MKIAAEIYRDWDGPELGIPLVDQVDQVIDYHMRMTGETLNVRAALERLDALRVAYRASRPTAGFGVSCPYCFGEEEHIVIDANAPEVVQCLRCLETFAPEKAHAEILALVGPWARLIEWIRSRPK